MPDTLNWLVEPLLGALDVLHRDGVYHRDISPDNLLLLPDGRPMLLDLGSARRAVSDRTQSVTALLKPNFAPVEQYADQADMRQGPWTDLYALGATVHFMLTGQAPSPAPMRIAAVAPSQAPAASGVSVVQASKPTATASAIKPQPVAKATPPEAAPMAPDATRSPSEFCGGQNFFTRTMCVYRECETPRWRAHPECVAARQAEEQRQRRMDQY